MYSWQISEESLVTTHQSESTHLLADLERKSMATRNKAVAICPECKENNTQHKCEKCNEFVCAICCMHRGLENVFRCKTCNESCSSQEVQTRRKKRPKRQKKSRARDDDILNRFENEFQSHPESKLEDLVNAAGLLVTGNDSNIGQVAQSMDLEHEDDANENDLHHETLACAADNFDISDIQDLSGEASIDDQLIQDLREACISDNSKKSYGAAQCTFIIHYWKYNKNMLSNEWLDALNHSVAGVESHMKQTQILKATIKKLLSRNEVKTPPINMETYTAQDFMIYLLSLRNKKTQKRLGFSAYNGKRAALYYLYRMYGNKQTLKLNPWKIKKKCANG